jgi:aryl-alcohol dehydrogenase-like predicted oxidoreductase
LRYREIPGTGLHISELAFGTGDNAGLMVAGSHAVQLEAASVALERGINYFDTSPDYGLGQSEENLGRVFRELGTEPLICTKVEIHPRDFDDAAAAVERSVEASLARLGLDSVTVVQVHNGPALHREQDPGTWGLLSVEDFTRPGGAIEGLCRVKDSGKAQVLGFTCAHADPEAVRSLIDTGVFGMINVWYNLLNPTAGLAKPAALSVPRDYEQIIDYAAARQVGVAVFRPLAGGALTDQAAGAHRHALAGGQNTRQPAAFLADVARAAALLEVAGGDGDALAALAYQFAIAHPGVTTVLGGFSDLQQLEVALDWMEEPPMTTELMTACREAWARDLRPGS